MKSKNEIIQEQQKTIENFRSRFEALNGIYEVQDELIKNLERRLDVFTKRAIDLRKERDDLSKQLEASKPFVCCCQRCRRRTDNDEK
jgi:uncharacterized protein YeeX (DUF496 family)